MNLIKVESICDRNLGSELSSTPQKAPLNDELEFLTEIYHQYGELKVLLTEILTTLTQLVVVLGKWELQRVNQGVS